MKYTFTKDHILYISSMLSLINIDLKKTLTMQQMIERLGEKFQLDAAYINLKPEDVSALSQLIEMSLKVATKQAENPHTKTLEEIKKVLSPSLILPPDAGELTT